MDNLIKEQSGWVLARVWLVSLEQAARDFFGNRPRVFSERAYEYATESFLKILDKDFGIKTKKATSIKEAIKNYIDTGVKGGLFKNSNQITLHEISPARLQISVMDCPYLSTCKDLVNEGIAVSNLTCARIGCFRSAVRFLANIDCYYDVIAFNTEDGCQGIVGKK